MDITPLMQQGKQVITGYGDGQFKVAGYTFAHPVIIFPDRTVEWTQDPKKGITLDNLEVVIEEEGYIDLLLIGCTKQQMIMPAGIRAALKEANIALDIMDTGGACRTYNILLAEGRRVAAALIPV